MKAKLAKINDLNDQIKTFWFEPEQKLPFIAGQYIEIYLPHNKSDDRGEKHWFSLSSSPTDPLLSITTRFSKPSSTFKTKLLTLKKGDSFTISQAMGDFVLPKDKLRPLVFVAGGIGITPIHSVIKWLSGTREKRSIKLIWVVSQANDLVFDSMFKKAAIDFMPMVSKPLPDWRGETGLITPERIVALAGKDSKNGLIYLSGPEPMIESLYSGLGKLIDRDNLLTDYFPGYTNY
ncbi:MAG TPA: FAD-dependent oxidoreductase [Candidatus Saccharimonadales bacterium]|nr:FAD-dependent oxidoreductase [Candidatus Saccharimonadales bacterium]